MADFKKALAITLKNEGGYVSDPQDPGGETYKGIARNMNSKWNGWATIDSMKKQSGFPRNLDNNVDLQEEVEQFYKTNYWDKVKGDDIVDQDVAFSIFDFGVNAGIGTAASLAQMVVGADADGVIGQGTLSAINQFDPHHFIASFTVAKIMRYIAIVQKRPTSQKYFYGWVRRAVGVA